MNLLDVTRPVTGWARDPLLETLACRAAEWVAPLDLKLADLCLGHPMSWAMVEDQAGRRAMGTVPTPIGEGSPGGERPFAALSPDWREWPLVGLPPFLMADHPLERCLALAVINAISQYRLQREGLTGLETGQGRASVVRWVIEQRPQRLVMIGHMVPLAAGLRDAGVPLVVFERSVLNRLGAISAALEWGWLAEADGLIVTGAALLNHTLRPLILLSPQVRFRLLVGFSAQAHPAFLADSGLHRVFSLHIQDPDEIRRRLQIGHWERLFDTEEGYMARLDAPTLPG